jgi:hypothetical protein
MQMVNDEALKATTVFTPGAFPLYTYVERTNKRYEERLRDAIDTQGQVISISGPSKSGKTVLVERVVGTGNLITITGAGINRPDDVWSRILDHLAVPTEVFVSNAEEMGASIGGEVKGGVNIPLVVTGEASGKAEGRVGRQKAQANTSHRRGLSQVIDEISNSELTVLIDDFHYMSRELQEEVAKQIKEAARQGVKIITASVSHRSDDVVRANPELRGRVTAIDLEYWNEDDLLAIAYQGFRVLHAELNTKVYGSFAKEAAGSPQLMQAVCLNACFELDLRHKLAIQQSFNVSKPDSNRIYERTAASTDFRSLVDVLDSGPKTRGTERKTYKFTDDTEGDVYRCVLKAVASDPPKLSFPYAEILQRVQNICTEDEPVGSSITGSCLHMSKLSLEKFPNERVLDWDEQKQVLDIPDPYLLFYLRWSGRLLEPEN